MIKYLSEVQNKKELRNNILTSAKLTNYKQSELIYLLNYL